LEHPGPLEIQWSPEPKATMFRNAKAQVFWNMKLDVFRNSRLDSNAVSAHRIKLTRTRCCSTQLGSWLQQLFGFRSQAFPGHQLELQGVVALCFLAEFATVNGHLLDLLAADRADSSVLVHVERRVKTRRAEEMATMGNGQILDAVHANDTVKGAHSGVVLLLLLAVEDLDRNFVLVNQVNHLLVVERAVAE
jgi:hypothetical protein